MEKTIRLNGIKTGSIIRVPVRDIENPGRFLRRNISILSDWNVVDDGVISTVVDYGDVIDIEAISYHRNGWKGNDGQVDILIYGAVWNEAAGKYWIESAQWIKKKYKRTDKENKTIEDSLYKDYPL